ncbi:DinB family protein [Flavilitoribacter nigricans]|uniref:DinB-like domain-containing protein n=1 Tax=Flavilitoribacter nigricans (strain ATCC 23147 / DSM 23189 / NBRC 102662 / NCIMB 1420 / SS-2) TaxID=1122177 RepID=A0A2D0N8I3_FLAN2|nr:DinB family protein [Flavilitoribacter nigricans]PHN04822.1 hypothetical protein CRP01_20140 [Flavilitoribacter nigricans DSM 23189 = NBRC 102662]
MTAAQITQRLEDNAAVFQALLEPVPEAQYRWKPTPEKWSLLEVICHLYDEEREDFRTRTRYVLEQPEVALPPIDPVGWVTQRNYGNQDYTQKIQAFLSERAQSVEWLRGLESPAWGNTNVHPQGGERSAFFFLSNWLAHDYLHIRQINRLKYEYFETHCNNSLAYAGNW